MISAPAVKEGMTFLNSPKETSFFALKITAMELSERRKWAIGNPYAPNTAVKNGVISHVAVVHIAININDIFTFPNALKRFISGVENEEIYAEIMKI